VITDGGGGYRQGSRPDGRNCTVLLGGMVDADISQQGVPEFEIEWNSNLCDFDHFGKSGDGQDSSVLKTRPR
jgi:hypothetical protein